MKAVADWDFDYILNLPQGEHDWLEFKSSKLLDFGLPGVDQNKVLAELSKQISAFANSGGGSIVYGIKDTPIGHPRTIDPDGGVSLNLKNGTKEWLEDVIPNLVDDPISVFNVYVLIESPIPTGKGIFIVEIPSSEAAPHQADDNRYYARVGGKSRSIGHRLVLDILGRAKFPKLNIVCSIGENVGPSGERDALICFCENVGKIYANYVNGYIYIPKEILSEPSRQTITIDGLEYNKIWFDNTHQDVVGYRKIHMGIDYPLTISRYDPVLPGLGFRALSEELAFGKERLVDFYDRSILWEIFADNAPIEKGSLAINEIEI